MTLDEMKELFDADDGEYLEFQHIINPRHKRPDLCAFLMLDELVPGTANMVAGAAHDEIYLEVDLEALAAAVTPEIIIDLRRCGVRYSGEGMVMFV